jgi:hypothetical protein
VIAIASVLAGAAGEVVGPGLSPASGVAWGVVLVAIAIALRAALRRGARRAIAPLACGPDDTSSAQAPEPPSVCDDGHRRPVRPRTPYVDARDGVGPVTTGVPVAPLARVGEIAGLASTLERSRRLVVAEELVARRLERLAPGAWIVERYVWVGSRRIPFVVLGIGGGFVLSASDGTWTIRDIDSLAQSADELRGRMPGYAGPVNAGICLAFDQATPRKWHGGLEQRGRAGWVLGIDSLEPWLYSQPLPGGVGLEDLRRLDATAIPRWERRSTRRLPARPRHG